MCEQGFDCSLDLTDENTVRGVVERQLEKWKGEQLDLKALIVQNEGLDLGNVNLVAGVDISFAKDDYVHACAAFVVVSFPDLKVVYQDCQMIHLTMPYLPEYLAFREATFFKEAFDRLQKNSPEFLPQVLLIDGNGILHPRGFGVACHVGVLVDLPTVGVAKQLFHVDGLENSEKHKDKIAALSEAGDSFNLVGNSGQVLGKALKSTDKTTKPVYVSIGHKINLDDAVNIVTKCCTYRIPEPVRQADIRSRAYIREKFDEHIKECEMDWKGLSGKFKIIEEYAQKMKLEAIEKAQEGIEALQVRIFHRIHCLQSELTSVEILTNLHGSL